MDTQEQAAEEYLKELKLGSVCYEPDGNIPPDFSISGNEIGVEVRRLNQNYFPKTSEPPKGLENVDIHIWETVRKAAESFDSNEGSDTYFLFVRFERPVAKGKKLKKEILSCLTKFLKSEYAGYVEIPVVENLSIGFFKSDLPQKQRFTMGGSSDYNRGGFLVSIAIQNIRLCIAEKEKKISSYQNGYSRWWLVLVDYIGLDLMQHEWKQIQDAIDLPKCWERVVVIDLINKCVQIEF